jgi:hypothetical protein
VDRQAYLNFLGPPVSGTIDDNQVIELVKQFCDPGRVESVTREDAKKIIDSGRKIFPVPNRTGSSIGSRKYSCFFCPPEINKCFVNNYGIARHNMLHFGVRNYECGHEGCNYAHSREDTVRAHIKRTHDDKGKPKQAKSYKV